MKMVYSCPFIPAEWIAAHRLVPLRLLPHSIGHAPSAWPVQGICPYARSFAAAATELPLPGEMAGVRGESTAIVVSTACDQMRRVYDLLSDSENPKFLFDLPHTWETEAAQKLYRSELLRFSEFMVGLGGTSPTPDRLRDTMLAYDDDRAEIRSARSHLSPRQYSELITGGRGSRRAASTGLYIPSGVPLALIGSPLQSDRFDIFDIIEKAGGYVALDATETGERTLPSPINRRSLQEDPISPLVDAYFGAIPDAFRRPNTLLYQWLKAKLSEREIKGIIFYRYLWCDTWHAEAHRLKEWSGLPFFDLDIGDDTSDLARTTSRLQSFMEMLR